MTTRLSQNPEWATILSNVPNGRFLIQQANRTQLLMLREICFNIKRGHVQTPANIVQHLTPKQRRAFARAMDHVCNKSNHMERLRHLLLTRYGTISPGALAHAAIPSILKSGQHL